MKIAQLSLTLAMSVLLAACHSSDDDVNDPTQPPVEEPGNGGENPGNGGETPEPEPKPEPEPAVLLQESFAGTALPDGWKQNNGASGAAYVKDGALFVDGRGDNYTATAVTLPLPATQNFRLEAEFTVTAANNNSRWVSFMYRVSDTANLEPYYQAAFRQNAAASNGTELAYRSNNAWNVTHTAAFSEALDAGKTYKVAIEAYNGRVRQYLDGVLLHDAEISDVRPGTFGIQAAGAVIRVEEITIKEQLKALPSMGDIYPTPQVESGVVMAPTLIAAHDAAGAEPGGAGGVLLALDASLNLASAGGQSAGTLAQLLDQGPAALPALRIADKQTVEALALVATERNLVDLTLISGDASLLSLAREHIPMARTALDLSQSALRNTRQDLLAVVQQTNRSGSKIAILPERMVERDAVAYLQRMLITPWAVSENTTPQLAAQILTTGINGIITPDVDVFTALLQRFPANTLLRKPLVVGHRGVPSQVDENTLEGAVKAVELGADAVESDIYLTTDNRLVIIHDDTLDRTTTGTGSVESYSLAELQALRTKPQGLAIPTLDEFFEALRGKPVTQFVEIKTANPNIIAPLKALIEKHGVQDQVIVISFHQDQLRRMRDIMPEMSAGLLTSTPAGSTAAVLRSILAGTQAMSSTFNPSYGNLSGEIMEAAKHRGTTFWPWTFRDQAVAENYYLYGTNGLTTDYAQWFSEYAVQVAPVSAAPVLAQNTPAALAVALQLQNGRTVSAQSSSMVVVDSTASYRDEAGQLIFTSAGQATVLVGHTQKLGGERQYTIFSEPVVVTVQ